MVGCNVGKLVKKPCSFLKVKSRFIRNNLVCVNQLVPEFNAHSTDCELSHSDVNVSIGICWDKLGVFQSVLDLITFWKRKTMFLLQKCYYLMVLYWSWIMSDLSETYHGQSSVLLFQTSMILHISQQTFFVASWHFFKKAKNKN